MLLVFNIALADIERENPDGFSELYSDFISLHEDLASGRGGAEALPNLISDYEIFRSEVEDFLIDEGLQLPAFDLHLINDDLASSLSLKSLEEAGHLNSSASACMGAIAAADVAIAAAAYACYSGTVPACVTATAAAAAAAAVAVAICELWLRSFDEMY